MSPALREFNVLRVTFLHPRRIHYLHAAFTGRHLAGRLQSSWKPLSASNDIIKIGALVAWWGPRVHPCSVRAHGSSRTGLWLRGSSSGAPWVMCRGLQGPWGPCEGWIRVGAPWQVSSVREPSPRAQCPPQSLQGALPMAPLTPSAALPSRAAGTEKQSRLFGV